MPIAMPRIRRKRVATADRVGAALEIVRRASTPTGARVSRKTAVLVGAGATAAGGTAAYLAGRGKGGQTQETSDGGAAGAPNPDMIGEDLAHKVESIVFRGDDVPKGDINVDAVGNVVTLRGQAQSAEMIGQIVERTEAIAEVQRVENLLHLPEEPAPNWPSPEDAAA